MPSSEPEEPRSSTAAQDLPTSVASTPNLKEGSTNQLESPAASSTPPLLEDKPPQKRNKRVWILSGVLLVAVLVVAIVVPVYFTVIKPRGSITPSDNSSQAPPSENLPESDPDPVPETEPETPSESDEPITGGDGSVVHKDDGTTFVYNNPFGGFWVSDPADPFNNGAKAQSWTPALNQTWNWGTDVIRGVNLGGWLVLEPFISPALFEKYANDAQPAVDEYSLLQKMRADGSLSDLEKHYETFITEEDFAAIAGAGLNWIRLPMGFWAIQTFPGEPYLERVSWNYVLKAMQWARKYGLRINLDIHAHPGSQNGWNHSGYGRGIDGINWLKGVMGVANAQRSLDYIRVVTQFISQEQYSPVVQMLGIVNEPRMENLDRNSVETFNYQAYQIIREITGVGAGKGPFISIHDGFLTRPSWFTFLNGADRLALDSHTYFAFDGPNMDPISAYPPRPCSRWGSEFNATRQNFGVLTAGEWSAAINDCGLYVANTIGYGGDCSVWEDWQSWDQATKDTLKEFVVASMDALQDWFFWTWRIGESLETGTVRAPFWSYKLGLQEGWIPADPREAIGKCTELGVPPTNPFGGTYLPWQIGNDPNAEPTVTAPYIQWPPASIATGIINVSYLPTYTAAGPIVTLPGPTVVTGVDAGDGWFNDADQTPMATPIAGCVYPDAYSAALLPAPVSPVCSNA